MSINNGNQATTNAALESLENRRAKAEALHPGLNWIDEVTAYCPCPGQEKHTTPAGDRDCRIKIDGVPTLSCVHASCEDEIKSANKKLCDALKSSTPVELTKDQKKLAVAKAKFEKELEIRTKKSLPSLLKNYSWPYAKIVADSPHPIQPDDRQAMFHAFMAMFENEDVVWIGEVGASGQPHHAVNFKAKGVWLAGELPTGPLHLPIVLCARIIIPIQGQRGGSTLSGRGVGLAVERSGGGDIQMARRSCRSSPPGHRGHGWQVVARVV
jgi:hypothetical protein